MEKYLEKLVKGEKVTKEEAKDIMYGTVPEVVIKIAFNEKITDRDIADELFYVCDREHSACNVDCPIYALKHQSPNTRKSRYGCDYYKLGMKMLKKLRKEYKKK